MKTNHCYQGDCRDVMRQLIADGVRVQTIVTSPPYWNLRDYGVAGQIGMEPTLQEFVATMVEVFDLCRELLADDGTLWLNLGSSYASGDTTPSQSLLRKRVHAYGTHGKESQGFRVADRACHDSCDEPQGAIQTRHADTVRSARSFEQGASLPLQTDRGIEHQDCVQVSLGALPPGAQASTTPQSFDQPPDASCQPATASASPQEAEITQHSAQECEYSSACIDGTAQMLPPLAVHTKGKESFFSACRRSSCKGIGMCGYCFASLSMASLNVKSKDELNIPHLVAMALQADGWYLRQTIIWSKNNPMPESVRDRCTKAHEYLFLLTKSPKYYFDQEAILEPCSTGTHARLSQDVQNQIGSERANGGAYAEKSRKLAEAASGTKNNESFDAAMAIMPTKRNKRSVWTIATQSYSEAHFATFPEALVEPCILAGSRSGDIVFDPFMGSGTVAHVAQNLGRKWIGSELNQDYIALQSNRTRQAGLEFAA
jgi:DNA modification methylase